MDAGDPDEQEEEEKSSMFQMQAFGSSHEGHAGSRGPEAVKIQQASPQLTHQHQGLVGVPSTSPIAAPDFFAKPKPPSR